MIQLFYHDIQWALRRLPVEVAGLMMQKGPEIFCAGGYIRACVAQEVVSDIDLFVSSKEKAMEFAKILAGRDRKVYETENALTVKGFKLPVQFIHRWTYETPEHCLQSFDFTIAKAAFWRSKPSTTVVGPDQKLGLVPQGSWESAVDDRFYADLAAKRLIYCSPKREEAAGGSLLRVLKFYQRGYRIPLDSLGAVMARLVKALKIEELHGGLQDEEFVGRVLTGLLREVDPMVDPDHLSHLPAEEPEPAVESS